MAKKSLHQNKILIREYKYLVIKLTQNILFTHFQQVIFAKDINSVNFGAQ